MKRFILKNGKAWAGVISTSVSLAILMGFIIFTNAQGGIEVDKPEPAAVEATAPAAAEPAPEAPAPTPSEPATAVVKAEAEVASPAECITDSSKQEILINLTYHGDKIEFFGTLGDTRADSVISILRSPAEKIKLNQKGKVVFVWMTVKQHEVSNVPFMYKIHASKKLTDIASEQTLKDLGIGFDSIKGGLEIHTTKGEPTPADRDLIYEGLMKLKKKDDLYKIDDDNRIAIKDGKLFKHYFTFPSAAKEGEYIVDSFLFRDGQLVGKGSETIVVKKVGLQAKVVHWANAYPKTYGVVAVIIALGTGLAVGTIFKKGGH